MHEPEFVVGPDERTEDGGLPPQKLALAIDILRAGGFLLLPSDTAYAVAMTLNESHQKDQINTLLDRDPKEPFSAAFADAASVEPYIEHDVVATRILERFTPGPITVVCTASHYVPLDFTSGSMGSVNHTIGVRITESAVERAVSAAYDGPITTTAVRTPRPENAVVKSFASARAIIESNLAAAGNPRWAAVDAGTITDGRNSTVVEIVKGSTVLRHKRDGAIPFEDIQRVADEE